MFSGKIIALIVAIVVLLSGNVWQYTRTASLEEENEALATAIAVPTDEESKLLGQIDDLTRRLRDEQAERTRQSERTESLDKLSRELGERITVLEQQLEAQRTGARGDPGNDTTAASGTSTTPRTPRESTGEGRDIEYVIRSGDLLQDLARRYYGDSTKWRQILDANKDVVSSARALRPGMKLVIPNVTRE